MSIQNPYSLELQGMQETVGEIYVDDPVLTIRDLNVYYGAKQAIFNSNLDIGSRQVLSLIGPSGCGKSTFIRSLNRINDTVDECRLEGKICFKGADIYRSSQDVAELRKSIGIIFQKANPFPKSIYDNVAYGPRIHGTAATKSELTDVVKESLERVGLYEEVADRLHSPGTSLSGGQQQRLCIARAIAAGPEVILMDEPCSALDPIATARIEKLINDLQKNFTIVIVTHSMQQAARVSARTAFFHLGRIVEVGKTSDIFTNPKHQLTENYITGRFG